MSVQPVDDGDGLRVLVVRGDLDAAVAPELLAQAEELVGAARDVVLDLSDVDFVDSGGLRLVDRLHRTADATGATFGVLAHEGSQARRLLDLVGMGALLLDDD